MAVKENKEEGNYILGIIGLGTIGRNLLFNMADHGYQVSGFDIDASKVDLIEKSHINKKVKGFYLIKDLLDNLARPKILIIVVPAGKAVDYAIKELLPMLNEGDIVVDAGNSHFLDTDRRLKNLKKKRIHFLGMGLSGGEEGARLGPCMMPGGDKNAYSKIKYILESISAKVIKEPCVAYVGKGASGHFVKMVHNGIEYGLMQLIAETYEVLKRGLQLHNDEIQQVFQKWNEGKLESYLLQITADIFSFKEPGSNHILLDDIKDEAKAKGTGKWTSQIAMDLNLPIPVIDIAVSMRDLSKYKELRMQTASLYMKKDTAFFYEENKFSFLEELEDAFYFSMLIIYAQGMHLLRKSSLEYNYELQLNKIAKIWRGGCIVRSRLLEMIHHAFERNPTLEHLLLDDEIQPIANKCLPSLQSIIISAISHGISIPAYSSSLSYFDALRSEKMPANLIQAQRDYFGAHTYERVGAKGVFHTQWEAHRSVKP